jgi:hypothetical protein
MRKNLRLLMQKTHVEQKISENIKKRPLFFQRLENFITNIFKGKKIILFLQN